MPGAGRRTGAGAWPRARAPALLLAALAGALLALAFAPLQAWPLAILAPAALLLLWEGAAPRRAAALGFAFSAGTFTVGTWWLYVSIHGFGQAPAWLAVLLMMGLVAIMGAYHALLGWLVARYLPAAGAWRNLAGIPALWLLSEWWRGWFLSGFSWLSLGYSQTDTWLAGLAPVGGVYLLSWLLLAMAGALVTLLRGSRGERIAAGCVLVLPWALALGAGRIAWTTPAGPPVRVAVVQGAIPQDQKWLDSNRDTTLDLYRDLTKRTGDARLIVWPESAAPDLANNIVPYLRAMGAAVQARGATLLMGVVRADAAKDEEVYYNSVIVLGDTLAFYDKYHLVPFAEFFPVPAFVRGWLRLMSLPYSDFTRGARHPEPLHAAGLALATTICYEDAYGSSRLGQLAGADALVNVTNDAWFGRSSARYQHLQISRMRALEARRWMVRAANDGVSALIGPDGRVQAQAPEYEPTVLLGSIVPLRGMPPYAHVGNWPAVIGALVLAIAVSLRAPLARRPRIR